MAGEEQVGIIRSGTFQPFGEVLLTALAAIVPVLPPISPLFFFLVTLMLGLGLIAWMLSRLLALKKSC